MNDITKANFWISFLITECDFPNPEILEAHLLGADYSDFCLCGCNSFKITTKLDRQPIAAQGNYGVVFEASFNLDNAEDKTLEILLFTGKSGFIEYLEVDCCGNTFQVPEIVEIKSKPFHTYYSDSLNFK